MALSCINAPLSNIIYSIIIIKYNQEIFNRSIIVTGAINNCLKLICLFQCPGTMKKDNRDDSKIEGYN